MATVLFVGLVQSESRPTQAADLAEATAALYAGDYQKCIDLTRPEVERGIWNDAWSKLLMRALLIRGEYDKAAEVYAAAGQKFTSSIPLRLLGAEALRHTGKEAEARVLLDQIPTLLQSAPWRFSDRENMVALGGYFLTIGEDAREVLDLFYDRTLKSDPKFVDAHIATAELALSKNDYQEAVKALRQAEKLRPEDPAVFYLLAKAWAPSDGEAANKALAQALQLNPHHVDSLLLQCEDLIDGERYEAADEILKQVLAINALNWKALSLQAVMAHMRGQYREEGEFRAKALSTWKTNPGVDYEIGRKLSRFYRFADAIKYERRSLMLDPSYMPARFQLAQDLLRTGATDEGWSIVDQVSQADKYNVVASNLRTLRERLEKFTTLEAPGLVVRMDAREARIYGSRVITLLTEAKRVLCEKYDMTITEPVTVEIFPQQSDFAIRTFGLPGGAGFLGVCFGKLITANSPASQGDSPSNWESVLWHEFCHVVTLQKTNNRMPRWLSEGISVYEELQRDPGWGQSMNPTYRAMLLSKDFVPLSKLSSAFLGARSAMHLQFAYFESSLAVRYLVERHGFPRLKKLLVDLGVGVPMQDALTRNYGDKDVLDEDFRQYALELANNLYRLPEGVKPEHSEELDEQERPNARSSMDELKEYLRLHPTDYVVGQRLARKLIESEDWEAAQKELQRLDDMWSKDAEVGGTLEMLALVYQQAGKPELERKTLERIVAHSSDNVPILQRLIAITLDAKDWNAVKIMAEKLIAVQPMIAQGHSALVEAANQQKLPAVAAEALESLLELNPIDPAKLHFDLAEARFRAGQLDLARSEVLLALEDSPRFRSAQQLLLKIAAARSAKLIDGRAELPDLSGHPPRPKP